MRAAQRNFLRRTRLERGKNFSVFFRLWAKNSRKLAKIFWLRCLNYILHTQKLFFVFFSWSSMTHFDNFGLLEKKFGRFFKTAFYRAKRIVIRNKLFSIKTVLFPIFPDMELNFLEVWLQKVSSVAKFPFDAPRGIFWGEQGLQKNSFLFFRLRAKNVRTRAKTFGCVLLTAY